MSWRDAARIAGPAYSEVAFQAIYAVRQGNLPPSGPGESLTLRARRRVLQSKLLVSAILALMSLGAGAALRSPVESFIAPGLDRGLYVTAILGAVLVLELSLTWWSGLQVLPTYLSSGTVPLLATLPIPPATMRRAAFLLLLRLFDAPALTCLIVTPLVVALSLGSWVDGLALLPGIVVVLVFAMTFALATGEFFVRHIRGAHSGPGQTALRWGYLLLWAVPAFAIYGFLAAAPSFLGTLTSLRGTGFPPELIAILAAFPMPLAAAPALAGGSVSLPPLPMVAVVVAGAVYLILGVLAGAWLRRAPLALAQATPSATLPGPTAPLRLATSTPALAILRKDLRIASRTPGFAFLILLPLLDALALGLLTFFARPPPDAAFNLGAAAITTSALLATFFGPALFALEVMGYAYVRALPLEDRSMVLAKVTLVAVLYLLSAAIVIAFTLPRVFSPLTFLAFIGAELPAVGAAALAEFGLLFRHARRRGLPVVNLYTGAWWATLVAIPGVLLAAAPLILYQSARAAGNPWALPLLAGAALVELAATSPLAFIGPRRGTS